MNVTFETVICAWDEKIPALLIRLVNTLLFCRTEEELRQSIDKLLGNDRTGRIFHLRLWLTPFLVQPAHFQRKRAVHPKPVIHCDILIL